MKKPKFFLIILSIVLALVLSLSGFMALRQDIAYRVFQRIASVFRSADCEVVDVTLKSVSISSFSSIGTTLMLVNSEHRIPESFDADLVELDGHLVSSDIAASFTALQNALCERFGETLCIRSSYRTKEEQEEIYGSLSHDIAAQAGASEHEMGMSLDVYIEGSVGGAILESEAGRYLHSHAHEYGFILRYPYGKSDITGIRYEPWHFRYVGKPHAEIIYRESLTLEEYILSFLEPNVYYVFSDGLLSRQIPADGIILIPEDCTSISISEDNCGGYIVTAVKKSATEMEGT